MTGQFVTGLDLGLLGSWILNFLFFLILVRADGHGFIAISEIFI